MVTGEPAAFTITNTTPSRAPRPTRPTPVHPPTPNTRLQHLLRVDTRIKFHWLCILQVTAEEEGGGRGEAIE